MYPSENSLLDQLLKISWCNFRTTIFPKLSFYKASVSVTGPLNSILPLYILSTISVEKGFLFRNYA